MKAVLDIMQWVSGHGLFEIAFGVGVWKIIRRAFHKNYEHLNVNVTIGGTVRVPPETASQSLRISLSNAGAVNLYVAQAYFRARQRQWWSLWLWDKPTQLRIHPRSDRIIDKGAFELKFPVPQGSVFSEYEALIRPGHPNRQETWLGLESSVKQQLINQRKCGVLYIEYATQNCQGVHKVNV